MRYLNKNTRWFIVGGIILAYTLILISLYGFTFKVEKNEALKLWKILTSLISLLTVTYGLFIKYIWKWKFLRKKFVLIPNFNGTWKGELISNWENPETGKKVPPIPTCLVIFQTFSKIKCLIYTGESKSRSESAEIIINEETNEINLIYTYCNTPNQSVRDRSQIHYGTVKLKYIESANKFEGSYWTDRSTTGELKLVFENNNHDEEYCQNLGKHPLS